MGEMTQEDFNKLINEILVNSIPLSLKVSTEDKSKAKSDAKKYIETKDLKNKTPLTMYYIIKMLPENEKINFIKDNIKYIKENDEEIFLYTMCSPTSLSYHFTFDNIKELYNIDKELFQKIIKQNHEHLFHGFHREQYLEFYKIYKKELNNIENISFINSLYHHNRCCYDNISLYDVNNVYTLQQMYNKEFISFILNEYREKIDSFNENEIRLFLEYIDDIKTYEELVIKYKEKLKKSFVEISEVELSYYLSETTEIKQLILFKYFKDVIVKKDNIKKIISKLSSSIIIDLFKNKNELFEDFKLIDWIQLASKRKILEELKEIIDSYPIIDIEKLFDLKFYLKTYPKPSIDSLKYIELKYRKNLKDNKLNPITSKTSIFSKEYFENLNYLKINNLSTDSEEYKKHYVLFLEFMKIHNIDFTLNNIREIETLFKRIVGGNPISLALEISTIEEITLINRLGDIEFNPNDFTIEQLKKYNVKKHKQLNKCMNDKSKYKSLTLKLMFMVGFNNAKKILEFNNEIPVLEHLVGNVDVKNIKLDSQGEPILNKRIINMLFNDNKIQEMLIDKNNDLYKYFPRIFNEWEMIKLNGKDKSINTIIDYLKSDEITLLPKYYRLEGLFKHIGCNNNIVLETLKLHDEMLKREVSTIPRITGKQDEYSYEILKYDDMISIAVGNMTDCCFTVLGVGYECLKHALTSKNGRVFVIKKDNEIIAHSWIWRNGNHICFDNIEVNKKITYIDFFSIYLEASNKLIEETYKYEKENCVTNITIGYTNFDKKIQGIENYPSLVKEGYSVDENKKTLDSKHIIVPNMPKPIENVNYLDSKNRQVIIKGNGNIKSYQSSYLYEDEREQVLYYNEENDYDKEYIIKIQKIINALRYIKYELENNLKKFEIIKMYEIKEIYCNNDWYYIEYSDGYIESFVQPNKLKSKLELENIEKNKTLCLK